MRQHNPPPMPAPCIAPKAGRYFAKKQAPTSQQNGAMTGYKNPPKNRQFGAPEGNKRHSGAWKKEDTPRYWLEQMAKMTEQELDGVISDNAQPMLAKHFAEAIKRGEFSELCDIINQVYGTPAKQVKIMEAPTPKPLIDLTQPEPAPEMR